MGGVAMMGGVEGFIRRMSRRSKGEPRTAVTAPVGRNSESWTAKSWTAASVISSINAPSRIDQPSCAPSRRAPASRATAGATSPTKPITPTVLTTNAVMVEAMAIALMDQKPLNVQVRHAGESGTHTVTLPLETLGKNELDEEAIERIGLVRPYMPPVIHGVTAGGPAALAGLQGTDVAAITQLHRIEKIQVIREVTAAGFKLVEEGTFLRNSGDDHTLPIFDKKVQGHTDQYALKFQKPMPAG